MKIRLVKTITIWTIIGCAMAMGYSQSSKLNKTVADELALPAVFIIGEHDKAYEQLMAGQSTLLDVCDNDMSFAYYKLMGMMRELEVFAANEKFNLKGINAWMHFFWRPDGSIDHIGFYLKPNSRNIPADQFKALLEDFAKNYKLNLKYNKKFSHYASFTFPLIRHEPVMDTSKSTAKSNSSKKGS